MKIIKWVLIICFVFTATGCAYLKSERKVLKYANKKFGLAEVIDKVKTSKEEATYTLKDSEYDFLYECTSHMSDFNMDGSHLFAYPTTTCSFDSSYKKYIYSVIKNDGDVIDNNLTVNLTNGDLYYDGSNSIQSFDLYTTNFNKKKIYIAIIKKLKSIDNRNYFGDFALQIYDKNSKEKLGVITSKDYELLTSSEEHDRWFLDYANRTFSENGESDSGEIEFIKKEEDVLIKDRTEIYNKLLESSSVNQKAELETAKMTIYYFYDNIAKINFYIIDYSVLGQACYFNNYSAKVRNKSTEQTRNGCRW